MPFIDALAPFAEAVDKWKTDKDRALELLGMSQEILKSELSIQEARNKYAQTMESMVKAKQARDLSPLMEEWWKNRAEKEKQLGYSAEQLGKGREVEAGIKEKTAEDVVATTKEKLETQKATTGLRLAQTDVAKQKISTPTDYQKIIDMTPELAGTPPTKDAITTRLKILRDQALNNKDTKQVEYLDSRISYTEAQTDVAQARREAIIKKMNEVASLKGLSPSQRLNAFKVGLIEQKIAEGYTEEEAFNAIMDPITITDLRTLINGIRQQLSVSVDDNEKTTLETELKQYQEMLNNKINLYKPREKQEGKNQVPIQAGIATITPKLWESITDRTNVYTTLWNNGARKVNFLDGAGKIRDTIYLETETAMDEKTGKPIKRVHLKKEVKPSTLKPTTTQKAPIKPVTISPEAQKAINALKSAGIITPNQLGERDIKRLMDAGIYDEVIKGMTK